MAGGHIIDYGAHAASFDVPGLLPPTAVHGGLRRVMAVFEWFPNITANYDTHNSYVVDWN